MAILGSRGPRLTSLRKRASHQQDGGLARSNEEPTNCQLCRREVERYTVHHLVPRSRGGRFGPTARLCATCHRQLHAMFSEATLAKEFHSIELLRSNLQVAEYLRWARRQKVGTNFRVRRANNRR